MGLFGKANEEVAAFVDAAWHLVIDTIVESPGYFASVFCITGVTVSCIAIIAHDFNFLTVAIAAVAFLLFFYLAFLSWLGRRSRMRG